MGLKEDILSKIDIESFYEAELGKLIGKGDWVSALCPFHQDTKPSLRINTNDGVFKCMACEASGSLFDFYMRKHGCSFIETLERLGALVGIEKRNSQKLTMAMVDKWADNIWNNHQLLKHLRTYRGFTDDSIHEYKLGWDGQRITVPYFDSGGDLLNVKRFLMQKHPKYEYALWFSRGVPSGIFPSPPKPTEDDVWICEGEWDAIILRQHGVKAYSGALGTTWHEHWNGYFKGKAVTICVDADEAGQRYSEKIIRQLLSITKQLLVATLPEIEGAPKNYDVSDALVKYGCSLEEITKRAVVSIPTVDTTTGSKELLDIIPEKGWIGKYINWAEHLTDAPSIYHLASALSVLSTVIGKGMYTIFNGFRVYPNLWVVLLGRTSIYRKSTSMRLGLDMIQNVCGERVLPNKFSEERLLEVLANEPQGILPIYEFGQFLKACQKDYLAGTKELLTELYDVPATYSKSLKKGEFTIERPYVNIFAASTIDWIKDRVTAGDIASGFLPRFLFFPSTHKERYMGWENEIDIEHDPETEALRDYLRMFTSMASDPIPMVPDVGVKELYNQFDRRIQQEIEENEENLGGFYSRLSMCAIKIAMLYTQSENMEPRAAITTSAMHHAIKTVDWLKNNILAVVDSCFENTRTGKELAMLRRIAEQASGEISRSAWLKASRLDMRRFDELVNTLVETGEYSRRIDKGKGRPAMVFVKMQ